MRGKAASAVLASARGAGSSSTLRIASGTLNTSGNTLTETSGYVNIASGTGNAYNPDAGVIGTTDGQGLTTPVNDRMRQDWTTKNLIFNRR